MGMWSKAAEMAGKAPPERNRYVSLRTGSMDATGVDDILTALGRIAGLSADQVVLAHKERYLRGRSTEEMETPMRAGLTEVGVGHVDSAPTELAGLELLHSAAHDGDVLAVWRLDRLGRSMPHLIETIGALEARGVGFRSLTEAIDTTTPGGRLIFHVFGALGQFERDLIRERTKAGLTAAAARGRKGGRKPVVTADKLQRAREHIANGLNVREAATRLKVSKTALYTALQSTSAADS